MPWAAAGAAISAIGSIGGGLLSSSAADKAASQQAQSQRNSLNWIQNVYGQTQGNLQPFIGGGQQAIGSLLGLYGLPGGNASGATQAYQQFQQTPFYQFPLQQANLATNRALAASGLTNSGGALRDLSQLNAGYASQGFGQYMSGLTGLANSGQAAAGNLGSVGVGTGAQIGAANTNMGNALAQGTYNSASGINQGIQGALPYLNGQPGGGQLGQSSYGGGGGLIGQMGGMFSGSGPFSANSLNSNFSTQFGAGTFPSASNPGAVPPGYMSDTFTPIGG